jgi:hypothetical protein
MRGQCVGGELVLAGGQQPSGTDTSRSATNSRSSGGRSPTTQLPARVGHRLSGRLNDGGSPVGLGVDGVARNEIGGLSPELRMALFLARQRDLSSTTFVPAEAPRLATKGGTRCLGRARQLYRATGLSPAQYESAGKRRDGSISPHSLQRVWRRSASTKRSTSRSLRPIPARIAHRSLLRATARTLDDPAGRRDGPAPPRWGGNDIALSVSLPSRGVRLGGSSGAVSVLVSVVLVCGHPGAFERSLRRRRRRSADQRGPRFADLESGLGASPRGFESRILRRVENGL